MIWPFNKLFKEKKAKEDTAYISSVNQSSGIFTYSGTPPDYQSLYYQHMAQAQQQQFSAQSQSALQQRINALQGTILYNQQIMGTNQNWIGSPYYIPLITKKQWKEHKKGDIEMYKNSIAVNTEGNKNHERRIKEIEIMLSLIGDDNG